MSSGERPIGAAKGEQPTTETLCHPPPPPAVPCPVAFRVPLQRVWGFQVVMGEGLYYCWGFREFQPQHPMAPLVLDAPFNRNSKGSWSSATRMCGC